MRTNRNKLILIICLFLSMAPSFGCASLKQIAQAAGDNREQLPVRSLTITIDRSQRDMLIDQLQKFANMHNYSFEMTDYGTGGEHFLIEMLGDNIKILSTDVPTAPTLVAIDIFDQTRSNPLPKETVGTINALVRDLKDLLGEIPNVTITEEK